MNDSKQKKITRWQEFARIVRPKGCNLLKALPRFPNAVLVTGCQRSGTTLLARIISQSKGMTDYWEGKDDELDAALILSGYNKHKSNERYCFQTTYLNECFKEYFEKELDFKIVWVLRNPLSVVYSMMHHWGKFAFEELFRSVGYELLENSEKVRYARFGNFGVSKLRRACLSYNSKTSHLFKLMDVLGNDNILVVDYDYLIKNKNIVLPHIYQFINLEYKKEYGEKIHSKSLQKSDQLSKKKIDIIKRECNPCYLEASKYITLNSN